MINLMMKTRLFKKEDNKRKKEKCENLNNDEKTVRKIPEKKIESYA